MAGNGAPQPFQLRMGQGSFGLLGFDGFDSGPIVFAVADSLAAVKRGLVAAAGI